MAPAIKLDAPGTVNTPFCVIEPFAVTIRFLPIEDVDKAKLVLLFIVTSLLPLLLKAIAPVNKLFCVKVIGFDPALKLDVPGIVNTPVWVIEPLAFAIRLFPSEDVPKINAVLLVMLTLLIPLLLKVTAPVNVLFWVKMIGLAPATKLETPGTVKAPVCVIAPFAVTFKLLPIVEAANNNAVLLLISTLLLPLLLNVTAPVKTLPCVKVIGFAPAVKEDVPGTVIAPICVIGPEAVAVKLFPRVDVSKIIPTVLIILTSFAPLLFNEIAPVKWLFCVSVIGNAPALKLAVPGTVKIPVWVIAPVPLIIKFLPIVAAVSIVLVVLVTLISLAPLLLSVIAPVSTLFWVNVIALLPAIKLEVPGTVRAPD